MWCSWLRAAPVASSPFGSQNTTRNHAFGWLLPTNVIISSWVTIPLHLHHGYRLWIITPQTIYPPDSPSYLHRFAWSIWFAIRRHLSALAVDQSCRSLFHDISSTKDLSHLPQWNTSFWEVGMSVLLELTEVNRRHTQTHVHLYISHPMLSVSSHFTRNAR